MTSPTMTIPDWPYVLEENRPWLVKVLRARLGDCHDVEDVYQEIAVAVLKQASRHQTSEESAEGIDSEQRSTVPTDPEKIAPWLYRLAIRHVVNFYRRTNRMSYAKPAAELEPFARQPQPLDWMLALEQQDHLQTALERLRPQDREILSLKYDLNWTYRQMAEHLGVPERNIEYRLLNARKRLRKMLLAMGSTESMVSNRN